MASSAGMPDHHSHVGRLEAVEESQTHCSQRHENLPDGDDLPAPDWMHARDCLDEFGVGRAAAAKRWRSVRR